jgi:hypothetical protein
VIEEDAVVFDADDYQVIDETRVFKSVKILIFLRSTPSDISFNTWCCS